MQGQRSTQSNRFYTFLLLLFVVFALLFQNTNPVSAAGDAWTMTGSLNTPRLLHTSTLLTDGKVLVTGGSSGSGCLASAEIYDPVTGTWSYTGSMHIGRRYPTATLLENGKVLVAGGDTGTPDSTLASAELYDPVTGTWSMTGSMNVAMVNGKATLLQNGKVLVSGGFDGSTAITNAEIYDPDSGTWTVTGSMHDAREQHSATLLPNGKVLIAGGAAFGGYLSSTELYDPDTGTWTTMAPMHTVHCFHSSTLLLNGKLLIAGTPFASTSELYDPITDTWTITGSMNIARTNGVSALLENGKVLVSGGAIYGGIQHMSSAELYDPATGTWSTTSSMNYSRSLTTAIVLNDGRVLVSGGYGSPGTSELFSKDTNTFSVTVEQAEGQSDPTNTSPVNFTTTFSEPIDLSTFTSGDVTLSGTAGATTASISEISPNNSTKFNIAVSGMTGSGIVIASIGADTVSDLAGNGNTASTSADNSVTYLSSTSPAQLIEITDGLGRTWTKGVYGWGCEPLSLCQDLSLRIGDVLTFTATASDPKGLPLEYKFVHVQESSGDLQVQDWSNDNTFEWIVSVEDINPSNIISVNVRNNDGQDWLGSSGDNSFGISYTVYGDKPPLISNTSLQTEYTGNGPHTLSIQFDEGVFDPEGNINPDDVTNPGNYLLVERGPNHIFDTMSCLSGVAPDDTRIAIVDVTYDDGTFTATINFSNPLPVGFYRLFACGSTSIMDLAGNKINGGNDIPFDFSVVSEAVRSDPEPVTLPSTGYAYGQETQLPVQPAAKAYQSTGLILEIPSLNMKTQVVGVPQRAGDWDITWLGHKAGYLYGSAFPTWAGNTVITGHVWNADNTPGIFADLKTLQYGDRARIHYLDQVYTYEVQVNKLVTTDNVSAVFKHEDYDVLTLMTCEQYDPLKGTYDFRRLVRAVLIDVEEENIHGE